jgi:hypothetical protein
MVVACQLLYKLTKYLQQLTTADDSGSYFCCWCCLQTCRLQSQ